MERKGIWPQWLLIAFATLTVFAWSIVMVVYGQVAAIAVLAPALGLTVQQIVRLARPQNHADITSDSGPRTPELTARQVTPDACGQEPAATAADSRQEAP
ncbi:hypothetical protein [Streptomyces sp. NBC_01601]|uniref:hypothetical protein n=1 Tax=Streptomyces sp. NBC_01601 TaxID=2975892 RepID=UPI002E2AF41D|nr:hypothetical protein [Streptomyces sp. NBC_01601]